MQRVATASLSALGCRHLSRVDFVVGDMVGDERDPAAVTLLEVNTLPGMTAMSLFPEAAARAGIPMSPLCASLVERPSIGHAAATGTAPARAKPRPLPL